MPSTGDVVAIIDFTSLKAQIATQATRRGVANPNPISVLTGNNVTAAIYNAYVDALNAINTDGTIVIPSKLTANVDEVQAWQVQRLLDAASGFATQVVIVKLPNQFTWSGLNYAGGAVGGNSTFIATRSGNTYNVTTMQAVNSYCGGSNHQWSTGGNVGSDIALLTAVNSITPSTVSNSEGKLAERLSAGFQYRRGCRCGNDQRINVYFYITALSNGTTEGYITTTFSQWGC